MWYLRSQTNTKETLRSDGHMFVFRTKKFYSQLRSFLIHAAKQKSYTKGSTLNGTKTYIREKIQTMQLPHLNLLLFNFSSLIRRKMSNHGSRVSILLSKLQCQIGHGLRHTLHRHRLIVREPVVLRTNTVFSQWNSRCVNSHDQNILSIHTCVSTLALSIRVLASAIKPLMAQPSKQRQYKVGGCWPAHCVAERINLQLGKMYFNSMLCEEV